MTAIAQEIDEQLQQLSPDQADRFENALRSLLVLVRDVAANPEKYRDTVRRTQFPIIKGTPGVVINPTKEELNGV